MNFRLRNRIETAGGYLLTGSIAIGLILLLGVLRASVFNRTIFFIGLVMAGVPLAGLLVHLWISRNRAETESRKHVEKLKRRGEPIEVVLSDCKIKSNNWSYQKDRYSDSRIQFLNGISGHGDKNLETVHVNSCIVVFSTLYKGKNRTFRSGVIAKDEVTLGMLLEMQKTTLIYVDPDNPKDYYFDLEFLDD